MNDDPITAKVRAAHYRACAEEADTYAENCAAIGMGMGVAESFRGIAQQWRDLLKRTEAGH